MSEESNRRRQYDRSRDLVQAVRVLTLMPDEVRTILSEGIIALMQQEFDEAMEEKHYRSLGSYKVLSLHKTKNMRRAYDQNTILHKAISRLYILSDEAQDAMGSHILELLNFIQKYFQDCTELQQDVALDDVAAITDCYVEKGSEDVQNFLNMVREEFYRRLHGTPESDSNPSDGEQLAEIASNQTGMKVKLELE